VRLFIRFHATTVLPCLGPDSAPFCLLIPDFCLQSLLAKNLVFLAQNNDFRPMSSDFCWIEQSKTHDRQKISRFSEVRDGSVQRNRTVGANCINNVGLKSFAVRQVSDQYSLVLFEFNQLGKISGNA
jgi:hypothetical protein